MTTLSQPPADTRRRRPAWLPTLAAFATIAICLMAGDWQHRRMLDKQALDAQMAHAASMPAVALPQNVDDWRPWRFRPVIVNGRFLTDRQILVDNRIHAGRAGFDVVTPLALDDGRFVLVDRGWTPMGPSRAVLPHVPPPTGPVKLLGRIDIPLAGHSPLGADSTPAGPLWQHIDPARFASATGVGVLPIVVEALDSPGEDGLARDWPLPDVGIEKHLGYMVQWYAFAAMAAGLWLWFTFAPRFRAAAPGRAVDAPPGR